MENGGDATRSNFIEILEVRGGLKQQQQQKQQQRHVLLGSYFSPLL